MRDAIHIINELRAYDLEREWFEFKVNLHHAQPAVGRAAWPSML